MLKKQESLEPCLDYTSPISALPDELLPLILLHLGIEEIVASIRLINTKWRTFADRLISEKIEVKKAALKRKFLALDDISQTNVDEIYESIKATILEAAENQYLPLLWENPIVNDNEITTKSKFSFNKNLRDYISRLLFHKISEQSLIRKNLQNADLSYSNNIVLWTAFSSESNLRGANFKGCLFDNTNFSDKDLSGVNFSNTTIKYVTFRGTNLSRTNFSNANIDCAILGDAKSINGANFTDAVFGLNYIFKLSLMNVNLTNANLKEVLDLHAENLLSASHLQGIKLPENFDFAYMNLSELNLSGAIMLYARLKGASACGTNFSKANLSGASLEKSILYKTDFSDCDLSDADLSHAREVVKANFNGANLTKAKLDYVDFSDTNITAEQLLSADSLLEIRIEKSNFTKEELSFIKSKMLNELLGDNYLCRLTTIRTAGLN
ncbi:MAG: pentapeptide repeat-containing protein [Tatlockia sp.]|nr:pentapeptide repeat-containing protein [Tatlockia sp.]